MRLRITFIAALFFAGSSFASQTRTEFPDTPSNTYSLEPAFTISSLGGGSQFLSVNLTARLASWFRLGFGGDLPATFDEDAQIFMARLFGRIQLLGGRDKVYLQGAIMQGFVSSNAFGNEAFAGIEGLIGYSHSVNKNWELGARLGTQLASLNRGIYDNELYSSSSRFYSRMSFVAGYSF